MKCTYNFQGKNGLSSQELDSILAKYLQEHGYSLDKIDSTLSAPEQENSLNKLKELQDFVKSKQITIHRTAENVDGDIELEPIVTTPGYMGVTRAIGTIGKPNNLSKPLITPFDEDQFFSNKRNTDFVNLTDEEFEAVKQNWKNSWKKITDAGTDIHSVFESLVKNEPVNITPLLKHFTEEQANQIVTILTDFISQLRNLHGDDAQFFSEIPIISKKMMGEYGKLQFNGQNLEGLTGIIDLLVIDNKGVAHIYDLKTSINSIGLWKNQKNFQGEWPSSKKNKIEYQLTFYRAILEQWGFTVGATDILPIQISAKYDESKNLNDQSKGNVGIEYPFTKIQVESIPKDASLGSRFYQVVREIMELESLTDTIDLSNVLEPLSIIAPGISFSTQVQNRHHATREQYKKSVTYIPETSPERSKGMYKYYDTVAHKEVYCASLDELNDSLDNYIVTKKSQKANEITDIAHNIQNAIRRVLANEQLEYVDLLGAGTQSQKDYLYRIFKKYINGGWQLSDNPAFIAAGVFIFTKNGLMEIVSLTSENIHNISNLGIGTSLLGAVKRDFEIEETNILKASGGNLDLIKVMLIINSAPEVFGKYRVNTIQSFNPWERSGTEVYNETLFDNFSKICDVHKIKNNLFSNNFSNTLESTISTIQDVLNYEDLKNLGDFALTYDGNHVYNNRKVILDKLERLKNLSQSLRNAIATDEWDFNDKYQLAYMLLGRALNKLDNHNVYVEPDPADWIKLSKDGFYGGLRVHSPYNSESLNVRTMAKIMAIAETNIRSRMLKYDAQKRNIFKKFFKAANRNQFIGDEVDLFRELFEVDENGQISNQLRLKDPNDSSLADYQKEFIIEFAELMNRIRFNDNFDRINRAKEEGTYYQIPLARGSFQSARSITGVVEATKAAVRENLNPFRLFTEQEQTMLAKKQNKELYNKYEIDANTREQMISDHGVDSFEINLDKLLGDVAYTYAKMDVMQEFLPRLQAIKTAVKFQTALFGIPGDYKFLNKYIDDYLDVNVYQAPIIRDPGLQNAHIWMNTVKSITTATQLGLNYRSGMRELLQGMWIHISRAMADAYAKDQFKLGDLTWAWGIICRQMVKNPNTLSLIEALNVEYGMANADPHQIQEIISQTKTGFWNFNSDKLYMFNRIPDVYHRMGFLLAKMKADGCWEAHSFVDDQLVYDWTKDARFSLLNDPTADKNSKEYKAQKGLYDAMCRDFIAEGYTIVDGKLPRAYTVREATSVKSFAEMCFGHYDRSTQMMAKNQFLGAFFLHFKTFVSAKLETWLLKPGTYNQGTYKQVYNEAGEPLVMVYYTEEGIQKSKIVLESEVQPGDNWVYYKEWTGKFIEGMAWTLLDFGKAIGRGDWHALQDMWKNDTKRANFKLFMMDMFLMSLIALFIKMLMEDNEDSLTPLTYTIGSAFQQSFEDANIFKVVTGSFWDWNPPALGVITNWYKQTASVVSGNKTVWEGAVNSFGVLRSLKYAIN